MDKPKPGWWLVTWEGHREEVLARWPGGAVAIFFRRLSRPRPRSNPNGGWEGVSVEFLRPWIPQGQFGAKRQCREAACAARKRLASV